MIVAPWRLATKLHLLPDLMRHKIARWQHQLALRHACKFVPAVLRELAPLSGGALPTTWTIHSAVWTQTNIAVIGVGPPGRPPVVMLKMPQTAEGAASLRRQQVVQAALHDDVRLSDWTTVLPRPHTVGQIGSQFYIVEQALVGRAGSPLVYNAEACRELQTKAATTISELHRRTATPVVLDTGVLQRWIDEPIRRLRAIHGLFPAATPYDRAFDRLGTELYAALEGQTLNLGWIHGDYWPGNLLVDDGAQLTGIVDWDRAAPHELATHDLLHVLLFPRALQADCQPGEVVQSLLCGTGLTQHERAILGKAELPLFDTVAGERALVLLYWLRLRLATLTLLPALVHNRPWVARNIENVLQCL